MREKLGYLGLKSCVAGLAGLALSILPATSAPIVISKGLRVDDGQLVQAKTGRSGKGVVVDKRGFARSAGQPYRLGLFGAGATTQGPFFACPGINRLGARVIGMERSLPKAWARRFSWRRT